MNNIDTNFNLNKKCNTYNIEYPNISITHRNKNDQINNWEIYTDGSKIDNRVGASIVIYKDSNCIK